MKIGEYEVVVTGKDAVKVGCVEVTREQAQGVLKQMDEYREGLVPSKLPLYTLAIGIGGVREGDLFVRTPELITRIGSSNKTPDGGWQDPGTTTHYNGTRVRIITSTELSAFVAQLLKGETK